MIPTWMMMDQKELVKCAVFSVMPYPFGKWCLKAAAHQRHRDMADKMYPEGSEEWRAARAHSYDLVETYYDQF